MTTFKSSKKIAIPFVVLLAILAFAATSAQAETLEPWWHLLSTDRPTNIVPGSATNEVQKLRVKATKGEYVVGNRADYVGQLLELEALGGTRTPAEVTAATVLAFDASAAEVQTALQRAYPGRVVSVSEKPSASEEHSYEIVFPGQSVPPILAEANGIDSFLGAGPLDLPGECTSGEPESCLGTASVTPVSEGKPDGELFVKAENVGDATVDGETTPAQISDLLPKGLKAVSVTAIVPEGFYTTVEEAAVKSSLACSLEESGVRASCRLEGTYSSSSGEVLPMSVPPFDSITMRIGVVVEGATTGEQNRVSVSGGGAPSAAAEHPIVVSTQPAPFGVEDYEMDNEAAGGAPDRQAGSHPFQTTFTTALNTSTSTLADGNVFAQSAALTKDLIYKTPPGWIGNPSAFEKCTLAQFFTKSCPAGSVIGATSTVVDEPGSGAGILELYAPLYNLEPAPGEAARLGYLATETPRVPVFIGATVRSGEDYGVTTHVENITQVITFLSAEVTIWGVPGQASHDSARGKGCLLEARGKPSRQVIEEGFSPCKPLNEKQPPAFLSLPTSCVGAQSSTLEADSWKQPGVFTEPVDGSLPALGGCNRLPFTPSIAVSLDVKEASKPSGLTVDVHVPQAQTLNAEGLAEADPKNIVVALPAGVQLNPSAADGLLACTQAEVGYTGSVELDKLTEPGVRTAQFTPEVHNPATAKNEVTACPAASKIATATVHTPLLPNPLEGAVYLASPQNFAGLPENPFSALVAMYLVVKDPISGVIVKLPGSVSLNQATGQITATFANSPQAPFEDAVLHFFGGERAPLATPALCRRSGEAGYQTLASFTPWTAAPGEPTRDSTSEFEITSGPGGGPCPNPTGDQSPSTLPFAPALASETTNINAGGFTPLSTTLSRPPGDQSIQSVTLHYPPGVSGLLSGVKLCPEAQANAGTCGPESEIGETIVSVGVGGEPFTVTGGKVYITEKYDGAPFGLSIVNPAKAGPFDLQEGRPVVVRAKIEVNPITAALTITTNTAAEGHAIPSIIEGFALQIQHVNVLVNRPDFTFNPTSCNPAEITGAIDSAEGSSSPVKVPFQVTNCGSLKFAPKFAVSTSAKTSRADGASLSVKLTYPNAPFGSQANIGQVKVELPKGLPSRLSTLQKACTAAQFHANPAGCPAASIVGHAKAITPLVPVPLEGPAYFVSNGGEAFPNLIVVLQGYGVTIDLVGDTFISKAGVTSSTFKTVPDAPVGSFELNLPEGRYSALTADGSLCKQKLTMPTEFLAQNGAQVVTSTKIEVQGCGKAKKAKHAHKQHHRKAKGKRKPKK